MSKNIVTTTIRALAASLGAIALFASLAIAPASAQSYGYGGHHQDVDGVVTYFNRFDLRLHVGPGQDVAVRLHQGTVINPTGITLRPGMRVDIHGYAGRYGKIEANRIDFDGWARGGHRR